MSVDDAFVEIMAAIDRADEATCAACLVLLGGICVDATQATASYPLLKAWGERGDMDRFRRFWRMCVGMACGDQATLAEYEVMRAEIERMPSSGDGSVPPAS